MKMATLTFIPSAPFQTTPRRHVLTSRSKFFNPLPRPTATSKPIVTARLHLFRSPTLTGQPNNSHSSRQPNRFTAIGAAIAAAFVPFLPNRINSAQLRLDASYPSQVVTRSFNIQPSSSTPLIRLTSRSNFNSPSVLAAVPTPQTPAFSSLRVLLPKTTDPLVHRALKYALLVGMAAVLITVVTIAVFWVIQDSLVYKPTKVWRGNPESAGMPYYDDVSYCTTDGADISGWFIKQPPNRYKDARTLIYFHGTDKNASFRLKKVIGFYEHCQCNILLLSYRGYGLSTGKPNERGVRIDAESAYLYLESRGDVNVGPEGNLWVYGESLGGAVAIHFSNAYQQCINALILENTFTSLLDMIKLEFPMLGIFRYLSRNRWQSKKRIGDLRIPLLFLSGLRDSYIPPAMMKQMHVLAVNSPLKEFIEFERGTHNRTWTIDGFYESVAQFMDRVDGFKGATVPLEAAGVSVSSGIDDAGRFATA